MALYCTIAASLHWLLNKCIIHLKFFIPLPNDKILDVTKLKAFADNQLNIVKMTISRYDRVENIVGKGENAGYQHFLLFPPCFTKPSSSGSLKVRIVWERVNTFVKYFALMAYVKLETQGAGPIVTLGYN